MHNRFVASSNSKGSLLQQVRQGLATNCFLSRILLLSATSVDIKHPLTFSLGLAHHGSFVLALATLVYLGSEWFFYNEFAGVE